MPRLRAVRTKEEAEKVPIDQPISVDLSTEAEREEPVTEAKDGQPPKKETPIPQEDIAVIEAKVPEKEERSEGETALQKQLDDLKKAEQKQKEQYEAQIRELKEAQIRAQREAQDSVSKHQQEVEEAQYETVLNALAAAQADAEIAQRSLANARESADPTAEAKAYRELTEAIVNVRQLTDGKQAFERSKEERKNAPPKQLDQNERFENAIAQLPTDAKTWLRARPEYVTDPNKANDLRYYHETAIRKGKAFNTPEYYEMLETDLGIRQPPPKEEEVYDGDEGEIEVVEEKPPRRRVVVSAPVSRDVPSSSTGKRESPTRVELTPEERDIAAKSGISDVDYAKMKIKLRQLKQNGFYQER